MARTKSPSAIRDQIKNLQKQLREAEEKEALRIGQIAMKAGVETLEVSDSELEAAFSEMVQSFRSERDGGQGDLQATSNAQ
ncbi:TraC family protein [Martelella mangrovi]|uniref:Methanogenic corrinoid protein MtbC1 n=1 Tax=Martelella mangrovi TaxID=1397477 RepID=A0ABV2ICP7_9HYPH